MFVTRLPQLRSRFKSLAALILLAGTAAAQQSPVPAPTLTGAIRVEPATLVLNARRDPHSLLVVGQAAAGLSLDLTTQATFASADEAIAKVDLRGWVQPVKSGKTAINVTAAGQTIAVPVEVKLSEVDPPYSFRHEVMPVLSKGGCNQGACHGYSLGKNGFKLSLRGADEVTDFHSLTREFFGRRIDLHRPAASMLITKPLGEAPHQGGLRLVRGSLSHEILLGWIGQGAPPIAADSPQLQSIRIRPEKIVLAPGMKHQLQLVATYTDAAQQTFERDVTRLAIFTANSARIASVDDAGLVTANELGETAIVARFERKFAVTGTIVLAPNDAFQPTPVPTDNLPGSLIDKAVIEKLNALKVKPSELAGDEEFLRRVYLALIGVQPKPEEIQAFATDMNPQKRAALIDALLAREEFIDHWSLKWGDLLQNSRNTLTDASMYAFREWIRSAVAANTPLDEFARRVILARGGAADDPAGAYYLISKDTNDTLERVTQVFCGVRMLCARCHPHPAENWTQADYYGLASFFNQIGAKGDPTLRTDGRAKIVTLNLATGFATNPRTGQPQPPRFLGGGEPAIATPLTVDRRAIYATWLTAPENPLFARGLVNRVWSYLFHRGIIEPVDDIRTTNPPINPELLDALTADFVARKFDFRHLLRQIANSQTFQRSSVPNDSNRHDDANFSHSIPHRLPAESLLDSLVQATGVPENFGGAPGGFTAAKLPDGNIQSEFLGLFGKPQRMEACECERDAGSNMLQSLHLINGASILSRVQNPNGRVALLLRENPAAGANGEKLDAAGREKLVDDLYLWTVCRRPNADERKVALEFLAAGQDKLAEAAQDLMWALLNSKDFMLVH